MRKHFLTLSVCVFLGLFALSCSQDKDDDFSSKPKQESVNVNKDESIARFAEILSKAAYERQDVRNFLKTEALEKFDNGYNVFYGIVKDKKVDGTNTFREILASYAESKEELENIETEAPLLNVHLPQIANLKVSEMDTQDQETPILCGNKFYLNGEAVDTLGDDQIPAFTLFVVDESGSVRKKGNSLKSTDASLSINSEYEFVDPAFSPNLSQKNILKTSGNEKLDDKYLPSGLVPVKDIDPMVVQAYKNSTQNLRATRAMVYYGMSTPTGIPGTLRRDVYDCIFRFKIAGDAFERLEKIATENGNNPFFNGSTSNEKTTLSREEVIRRLLTGRAFCFMFRIEGILNGQTVATEGMKIYVTPEKLFNLYIDEARRHPTMFRRTKYTYSINKGNIKEKWYYPMDHGHDTRLNEWDIAYQPITKRVVVYLVNPNDGVTKNITERYNVTYVTSNEVGADITGKIKEIVTIGVNGKISNSTTKTKEVTTTYTVTSQNEKLDEFYFDFFNDFPIKLMSSDGKFLVPIKKGKGIIETSILPISDLYYTYGRFQ